jgi:hypothetical protein
VTQSLYSDCTIAQGVKKVANFSLRFGSCADATENDIDRADGIDPKGFYMQLFAAQFGVWLSWATWLVFLLVISSYKIYFDSLA